MAYLQLADNAYSHLAAAPMKYYIFIPQGFRGASKDSYVREDIFDSMDPMEYAQVMRELEPYQNTGMSAKDDKADRKAARADKKATQGGGARRDARAMRQKQRQDSKLAKVQAGGGVGNILGKVVDGAKSIFGKNNDTSLDIQGGGSGLQIDYNAGGQESFLSKYKVPLIIGGVAVVAGTIYLITKKKK